MALADMRISTAYKKCKPAGIPPFRKGRETVGHPGMTRNDTTGAGE
jgi:hypothetical protein